MRRVTDEELAFYDRVAERISILLGNPQCPMTQSSLAQRIGWNRASLCNFLNRIDKSIAAHFVPRIARVLRVPAEHLLLGKPSTEVERTCWDPRWDEPEAMLDKIDQWKRRNLSWVSLRRILPAWVMPTHAMLVNYVDSVFDGASPVAAERWHELAELRQNASATAGAHDSDGLHIMFMKDLMRIPERIAPYHGFSTDEIVCLLEHLKAEWVSRPGFRLIAAPDSARTADVRLEMAGNRSLTAIGREVRIESRDDFRVHWTEEPNAVGLTRECLGRLKKSAGLGLRDDPSPQELVRLLDCLLSHVEVTTKARGAEQHEASPHGAPATRGRASSAYAAIASVAERGVAVRPARLAS